ncbi:ABC transporter ATP-binding protein [Flavobacterium oncorhynchi]|uniref:ABC transporter ATP-binding protein n=1 Tax=Flavobacterium oncorhynchi TaxID=728056 RepID=UPI000B5B684D|nr:ABC transporter ATP-binding protein [Flavobacterium oncorhynchi]
MKDIILKVEKISKQYRLGQVGTGTISHDLNRWWYKIRGKEDPYLKIGETNDRSIKGTSDYVWALQNINFEVKGGEVLAIIGKNGAGKSTLLKILSKVTAPTTGSIKSRGRIASLLEVGTGFNGELTGRENIFLNGAILGMTKKEIISKLDEIIEFSGCERYIDTPVKRYSSGMNVRLAFAVAAFLEPEILVVDEVLAVGDAEFQKKAIGKMQDIAKGEGRTVLFVSHNMAAIKSLCTRGIVLEHGKVVFEGEISESIDFYSKITTEELLSECIHKSHLNRIEFNYFKVTNNSISILQGQIIELGDKLEFEINFKVLDRVTDLSIAMDVLNTNQELFAHITNEDDGLLFEKLEKGKEITIHVKTDHLLFIPGFYTINLWIGSGQVDTFYTIKNLVGFYLEQSSFTKRTKPFPKHSKMYLPTKWNSKVIGND